MNREERTDTIQADEQLRASILHSPEAGWRTFLEIHSAFIRNIIKRHGFSIEDSEEVLQEVFHNLLKEDCRFFKVWDSSKCTLRGFLSVVATHAAITFYHSRFHRESFLKSHQDGSIELDVLVSPSVNPAERLFRIQAVSLLTDVLDRWVIEGKLDSIDKKIVLLRLRGLSFKEISDVTGMTVNHTTVRFSRLKPRLQKLLARKGLEEDLND